MVKQDREEASTYAGNIYFNISHSYTSLIAMLATVRVVERLQALRITSLNIKIRGQGGVRSKSPGPGGQAVLRSLARKGIKIGRIEDVTPIPTDHTRKKGGRRGRRL